MNEENKKSNNPLHQYTSYMNMIKGVKVETPEEINDPLHQYTSHMNMIKGVKSK